MISSDQFQVRIFYSDRKLLINGARLAEDEHEIAGKLYEITQTIKREIEYHLIKKLTDNNHGGREQCEPCFE